MSQPSATTRSLDSRSFQDEARRASAGQQAAFTWGLSLRLAWRNVWRHRRRTLIIVLAIGLGLALMMLYDGLIAGFDQAIYGNDD